MNVYKVPYDLSTLQTFLNWTPTPRTVAIDDFISVYWAWQPGTSTYYGQGEYIDNWTEKRHLTCLIKGELTHRAGNTLELAQTNVKDTFACVCL